MIRPRFFHLVNQITIFTCILSLVTIIFLYQFYEIIFFIIFIEWLCRFQTCTWTLERSHKSIMLKSCKNYTTSLKLQIRRKIKHHASINPSLTSLLHNIFKIRNFLSTLRSFSFKKILFNLVIILIKPSSLGKIWMLGRIECSKEEHS